MLAYWQVIPRIHTGNRKRPGPFKHTKVLTIRNILSLFEVNALDQIRKELGVLGSIGLSTAVMKSPWAETRQPIDPGSCYAVA